tara:strand:+ start:333 stop:707 length:375 start_codon:yes stop_codon:yes gene_type:complete
MGNCISCVDEKFISLNETNIYKLKNKIHMPNNEIQVNLSSYDDMFVREFDNDMVFRFVNESNTYTLRKKKFNNIIKSINKFVDCFYVKDAHTLTIFFTENELIVNLKENKKSKYSLKLDLYTNI